MSSGLVSDRVRREWSLRVVAEYTSAAVTSHLTWWLVQLGTSPDLIEAALDITRDELEHARLAHRVCIEAGAPQRAVIPGEQLSLPRSKDPLLADVVRACVREFCINETLAVPLFRAMRSCTTVTVAREALDRVLLDEVRHRDFGWALLQWLVEHDGDVVRPIAKAEAERELARREALCCSMATGPSSRPLDPADAGWGLIEGSDYGRVFARCRSRDLLPRFAGVGLDLDTDA
jgi:hypothetical protein